MKHLRKEQIWGRFRRLLPGPSTSTAPPHGLRKPGTCFRHPIYRTGPIRRGSSFSFLNLAGCIEQPEDWNRSDHARLWLYNLHYFDWLKETAALERVVEDARWIDRWIAENPVGQGAGWEPYPLSLRIVNWIIWLLTIGKGSVSSNVVQSLAVQARHLENSIEHHLLGNHLFVNAKALVFAGAFFSGEEAERWLSFGLQLLQREIPEQILDDGAHFELSPMYHELILEDVLDLIGLSDAYPGLNSRITDNLELKPVAARMTRWLTHMLHPDGDIPYFNDAAFGIAPPPNDVLAYARRHDCLDKAAAKPFTQLRPSGYVVFSVGPLFCVFDCGRIGPDYIPGHAHADTLSFELSLGQSRVISNSGTSSYAQGPDREWERSTRAHATVEIDGANSAETWASFRVGRRPNVSALEFGDDANTYWAQCEHDGYRHLAGAPIHRRRLAVGARSLEVTDVIEGAGVHSIWGVFPIHPGTSIERGDDGSFRLVTGAGECLEARVNGPVATSVTTGRFATGFSAKVVRPVLKWRWRGTLPLSVQTQLRVIS